MRKDGEEAVLRFVLSDVSTQSFDTKLLYDPLPFSIRVQRESAALYRRMEDFRGLRRGEIDAGLLYDLAWMARRGYELDSLLLKERLRQVDWGQLYHDWQSLVPDSFALGKQIQDFRALVLHGEKRAPVQHSTGFAEPIGPIQQSRGSH